MHILIQMTPQQTNRVLEPAKTIFLRPTPWKIAWQAGVAYLARTRHFSFAVMPSQFLDLRFEYLLEDGELLVNEEQHTVFHTPIEPLSFVNWMFYGLESFAYGFFEQVWAWRWDAGTLTRQELQKKVELLDAQLQQLMYGDDE